jgi:hypothetical protein
MNCGDCVRGLTEKKELCGICEGTTEVKVVDKKTAKKIPKKKEGLVAKVKKVLKKK